MESRIARDRDWGDRSGRLFREFERPAKAMVRRAFRGAFSADELDDIYAGAWVGTLRSLAVRHEGLEDDEIRSYVLTAVANQASKELRRRRRKPTAPLELVGAIPDATDAPDERAAVAESSSVTRDLLASLPPRRRAVILLRYGWGLEPKQVCGLVDGLSPRAYRKEITRGVDEVTEKMRALEAGEWCRQREPLLKTFVAGTADTEQERQARAHLAHCRRCGEFVARLRGHLHDLGGAVAGAAAIEGIGGRAGAVDRVAEAGERLRELGSGFASRGDSPVEEAAAHLVTAGGARGAGAAGAGVLAKLAGIGTAGKLAAACLGGGAAATACIAAGVVPLADPAATRPPAQERHVSQAKEPNGEVEATPAPATLPAQVDPSPGPPGSGVADSTPTGSDRSESGGADATGEPPTPVAADTPPVEQEFGVAPAAAPVAPAAAPAPAPVPAGGGGAAAVREEFAP